MRIRRTMTKQKLLNDQMAEVVKLGQDRGWANPNLDPNAVALFVQGYPFGLLLNDVAEEHVNTDNWVKIIDLVMTKVVLDV